MRARQGRLPELHISSTDKEPGRRVRRLQRSPWISQTPLQGLSDGRARQVIPRASKEVLLRIRSDNRSRCFAGISSPLTDSNRPPPPYHGGFALLRWDLGEAPDSALSLQFSWFLHLSHPSLEVPWAAPKGPEPVPRPSPNGVRGCRLRCQQASVAWESAWASVLRSGW
jgi:hypothetical protein